MMRIIVGLFCLALGIWGVFDEWYYVVDVVKGASALLLILAGLIATFAGTAAPRRSLERSAPSSSPSPR